MKTTDLYRTVSLIRHAELKIVEVYEQDIMQTPVHLSIGQESIAAALCAHLNKNDLALGTHRGHALYLAKGGNLMRFFAELLGRVDGCSGGYGGSMHLIDLGCGLLGTSSIVGGALPISVGVAMATQRPRLTAVLFGDGACDEGVFYESVNFASLWKLPLVFVCENNRYSVQTHRKHRHSVNPCKIAEACGMRSLFAPIEVANDVVALNRLLEEPIQAVRQGKGPLFVECETVRALDHHGIHSDIEKGLRPKEEGHLAKEFCPMFLVRKHLDPSTAAAIDLEIRKKVDDAFEKAIKSEPLVIEGHYEQLGNNSKTTGTARGRA